MSWKEKRKRERASGCEERECSRCASGRLERKRELVSSCLKRLLRLITTERVDCLVC